MRFPWRRRISVVVSHEPVTRSAADVMLAAVAPNPARAAWAEVEHGLKLSAAEGYARGYAQGSAGLPFDPRIFDLVDETAKRFGLRAAGWSRLTRPDRDAVAGRPTLH